MELTIEKLIYGGDGLARTPPDPQGRRKAVFIPFVMPGEQVEATLVEEKPGFARARVDRILEGSPQRAQPACPYFGQCGGCHYQHIGYEQQLGIKASILRETVQRIAKLDLPEPLATHPSRPWNYRNRTRLKLRPAPEFALGYYRLGSHALLPVRECPISSPLINRALAALWDLGIAGQVPADIQEVELFANAEDQQLLVELQVVPRSATATMPRLAEFAQALRASLPEVAGVAVFTADQDALLQQDIPEKLREAFGAESLTYNLTSGSYQVSAGSFFQTNRFLTGELVRLATADRAGDYALDLYAGTGLFSLPLSQTFREVAAVEAAPFSYHDLRQNSPSNVTGYRVAAEKFLARLPAGTQFDYIVVDPPRIGLGEKLALVLGALQAPAITYVSCDPSTLARDLRVLMNAGYRVEQAHLVDLFPETFHIETVLWLGR